jgi:outer membrane protein assembly factor BamA
LKLRRVLLVCALLWAFGSAHAASVRWTDKPPEGAGELEWSQGESAAEVTDRVSQWLSSRGYFWSRQEQAGDTLQVTAGPRAEAGEVHAEGDVEVPAGDLRAFKQELLDGVDDASVHRAMEALVSEQVSRGRPFTQVRLLALDVSRPPAVDFELAVYSGPEVYGRSLVTGAQRTSPLIFEREAGWRRGALLESDVIAESEKRLETLPYVAQLDTALLLSVTGDTADLYLGVREASGVHAEGVLGWVPGSAGTEGYWAGEFDVQLRSAFGDGRTVGLRAARPDPESQRTGVNWWEPWPWGVPLWLGADLSQEDFARDYIETKASLSVRLATRAPRWQFSAGWGRVTLEDDPSPGTFPAEYWRVGVGAIDSSATSAYRFEFEWSSQNLSAYQDTPPPQDHMEFTQGKFAAHRWVPLSRSLQLRGLASGAGTLLGPVTVPQHLLYRVGGIYSLRGYREQQFAVRDYLRLAWEAHLGSRQQSVFVFVDAAWLNFQSTPDRILGAAGIGLQIAGRVQLSAAVPGEGGLPETKIHVSVSTGR